jgi:hypothetical protein
MHGIAGEHRFEVGNRFFLCIKDSGLRGQQHGVLGGQDFYPQSRELVECPEGVLPPAFWSSLDKRRVRRFH